MKEPLNPLFFKLNLVDITEVHYDGCLVVLRDRTECAACNLNVFSDEARDGLAHRRLGGIDLDDFRATNVILWVSACQANRRGNLQKVDPFATNGPLHQTTLLDLSYLVRGHVIAPHMPDRRVQQNDELKSKVRAHYLTFKNGIGAPA